MYKWLIGVSFLPLQPNELKWLKYEVKLDWIAELLYERCLVTYCDLKCTV